MSASVRHSTDPRISRRRKAVLRTRRRRILWRAALAALVAVAVWAAFFSPLLEVKKIQVTGGRHTTAKQIARVAGLDSSDNLLLVSTSSVAVDAATLPWVKTVEVERKLPGMVKVRVTERTPSMILPANGRQWLVDGDGRVLASGGRGRGLPVIAGSPVGRVEPGDTLDDEEVTAALAVFRSLPASLRRQVEAFSVPTVERLTFSLGDGTQVRYGSPEERASKNEVLRVLLRRQRSREGPAAYIDVRVPTSPAVATSTGGAGGETGTPPPSPGATVTPTASPSPALSPAP